jgi:Glycosyltransferase family 87
MEQMLNRGFHPSHEQWMAAFAISIVAAAITTPVVVSVNVWAGASTAGLCFVPMRWIAPRMPEMLSGARQRRPVLSVAWLVLVLLAVVQMTRLSAFMVDSSRLWGSTIPDQAAANHQCLAAYVHAADLCRRGERNVYDERWYPAFTTPLYAEPRGVSSPVAGLGRWVLDPYEYPPPFLLLPRAALAITDSFERIRTAWFVIQALCLVVGGLLLMRWIGGREGLVTGLLLPAILASIPTMLNFQFGQFHAMAVMLALAAMVAFDRRRFAVGGTLLSFAILSKIFPGVLLVMLTGQRRWREIGWTLGIGVVFVMLALLILGTDPFIAFVSYQLPRILSGEAFSFSARADVPSFIVSRNFSVYGIVAKLRLLGLAGVGPSTARVLTWGYTMLLLWLAWRARTASPNRRFQAMGLARATESCCLTESGRSVGLRDRPDAVVVGAARRRSQTQVHDGDRTWSDVGGDHGPAATPGQDRPGVGVARPRSRARTRYRDNYTYTEARSRNGEGEPRPNRRLWP